MKIFISYTLKDKEVRLGLLKKINAIGARNNLLLFIDKLHNHDSDPQRRIEIEIQNSDFLILVGSKSIFKSVWVKKEVLLARENNLPIFLTPPRDIIKTIKSVCR